MFILLANTLDKRCLSIDIDRHYCLSKIEMNILLREKQIKGKPDEESPVCGRISGRVMLPFFEGFSHFSTYWEQIPEIWFMLSPTTRGIGLPRMEGQDY
jgi:hypothetical protein